MGETLDVSVISHKVDILEALIYTIKTYVGGITNEKVSIMDNWMYKNVVEQKTLLEAQKYVDDKIIFYEAENDNVAIGCFVERIRDYYSIEGWINPKQEIDKNKYIEFLNFWKEYFKEDKEFDSCAIGKETSINYDHGIYEAIKTSSDVDLWIIKKTIVSAVKLKKIINKNTRITPNVILIDDIFKHFAADCEENSIT